MENNNEIMNVNNILNHNDTSKVSSNNFDNVGKLESSNTDKDSSKSKVKKAPIKIKKNISQEEIDAQIQALIEKRNELEKERIEAERRERASREKEAIDSYSKDLQTFITTLSNDSIIKALYESGVSAEDVELELVSGLWKRGDKALRARLLSRYKRVTTKKNIFKALEEMNNQSRGV